MANPSAPYTVTPGKLGTLHIIWCTSTNDSEDPFSNSKEEGSNSLIHWKKKTNYLSLKKTLLAPLLYHQLNTEVPQLQLYLHLNNERMFFSFCISMLSLEATLKIPVWVSRAPFHLCLHPFLSYQQFACPALSNIQMFISLYVFFLSS